MVVVYGSELDLKAIQIAAFCFLLLMMSGGITGRHEGNVFRLALRTKTFLTELALIKVAMSVCQKTNLSPRSLATI